MNFVIAAQAAFRDRAAAFLRLNLPRSAADCLACRESDEWLAVFFGSLCSTALVARERRADGLRFFFAACVSCFAFFRSDAEPFGGLSFTPALRALERPMAMACCGELAPCFPSRT